MEVPSLPVIRSGMHLSYLMNTIDFDCKGTRNQISTKSIPIFLHPEKSSHTQEITEVFRKTMTELYSHQPYELKEMSGPDLHEVNSARKREFFELYRPSNYDPALNDIQLDLLPRVVDSLQMRSEDSIVDLGSSTGRLILATRMLSECASGVGVELSPSRTSAAIAALERVPSILAQSSASAATSSSALRIASSLSSGHTSFLCGDICDAEVIRPANVYFFGTGRVGRKELIPRVISAICAVNSKSEFRSVRIICAGFTLPSKTLPGVKNEYGLAFKTSHKANSGEEVCPYEVDSPVPKQFSENMRKYSKFYEHCYGDTMGPRVLIVSSLDLDVLSPTLLGKEVYQEKSHHEEKGVV